MLIYASITPRRILYNTCVHFLCLYSLLDYKLLRTGALQNGCLCLAQSSWFKIFVVWRHGWMDKDQCASFIFSVLVIQGWKPFPCPQRAHCRWQKKGTKNNEAELSQSIAWEPSCGCYELSWGSASPVGKRGVCSRILPTEVNTWSGSCWTRGVSLAGEGGTL